MKQVLIAGLCTVLLLASAVTRAWDPNEDEEMEANAKAPKISMSSLKI